MSSFTITSGDNSTGPFGVGGSTGEGFADTTIGAPDVTNGVGSSTPQPASMGGAQVAVCANVSTLGVGAFVVSLNNPALSQSAFVSISFTDRLGSVETYVAASATFTHGTGVSTWTWPALLNFPFNNGVTYTMDVVDAAPGLTVPSLVGLALADAIFLILAAGFTVGTVTGANNASFLPGQVSSQSPAAASSAPAGSAIAMGESLGPVLAQSNFVPAKAFKAIMMANPGTINPRVYPPLEDTTVRVPLPRLPL